MNTEILTKCVAELRSDKPNIQYVLGMLETLVAMSAPTISSMTPNIAARVVSMTPGAVIPVSNDEAAILDAKARANIAKVREMSHE